METENHDELVMYIVINTDLDMDVGKIAGAAGHSVQYFLQDFYSRSRLLVRPLETDRIPLAIAHQWISSKHKKIVVAANNKEIEKALALEQIHFIVKDAGLTEVPEGSITAISFWPMRRAETPKLLRRLRLLKSRKENV